MISGAFGMVWTLWGASGIAGPASRAVRLGGIVVGLVIVVWSARLRWSALPAGHGSQSASSTGGRGSMFSSPGYLLVVALQVVAFGGGSRLLTATGHSEYIITWIATVVGIHFLAFGRLFFAGYYVLGTALIAAGVAGTAVGITGGGAAGITATTGLIAAASLFGAGSWAVMGARAPVPDG